MCNDIETNDYEKIMKCDADKAIDFLLKFDPDNLWSLTAIEPRGLDPEDGFGIVTECFSPEYDVERCKAWIQSYNDDGWNVYFTPNPPLYALNKKAKKEDIKEARWLYVDIDARGEEDLTLEKERILDNLTSERPKKIPEPTLIIDSGGGMWGFWKLEEPIVF